MFSSERNVDSSALGEVAVVPLALGSPFLLRTWANDLPRRTGQAVWSIIFHPLTPVGLFERAEIDRVSHILPIRQHSADCETVPIVNSILPAAPAAAYQLISRALHLSLCEQFGNLMRAVALYRKSEDSPHHFPVHRCQCYWRQKMRPILPEHCPGIKASLQVISANLPEVLAQQVDHLSLLDVHHKTLPKKLPPDHPSSVQWTILG